MNDIHLAPKLATLEHISLERVLGFLYKGLEEGKITVQDIGRWQPGDPPH